MAAECVDLRVPDPVRDLFARLGDRARVVGGAIRDRMFGEREVLDWDLVTALESKEVVRRFVADDIRHDAAFGVVRGRFGRIDVSVATYRVDGTYADRRHPESVEFVADLRADAERRDFSINAIYADLDGVLEDPVGGRVDAVRRVLRVVGDARARLAEDPLRALRGVRFAARFGLLWGEPSLAAARDVAAAIDSVPPARAFAEVDAGLANGAARLPTELDRVGLWRAVVDTGADSPRRVTDRLVALERPSRALLWSAFVAGADDAGASLLALSAPRDLRHRVAAIVAGSSALAGVQHAQRSERRLLLESGTLAEQLALLRARACAGELEPARLAAIEEIAAAGPPPKLVSGDDVLARGIPNGPAVRRLLAEVESRLPDDADRSVALAELDACIARWVKPRRGTGR